ncbi:hypothetical protein APHMUC_0512 [Anaplasma phagocytophilum str. ApMUC09]|uniref:Uncharacterized protein n=1 Tax=Anaplasma phagocytophilum str. ApMUC09 TaxID=1359152 RepID=A0A0F3NCG5_ANAPH|nr:hypothetical protein APHMUC_0512 [Anaplasma phagocytophilum str. ApMUC09]SCV63093.1 hypothetical protein ANAPH2_00523 [Anaplasma phagocytophilum]
MLSPKNLIAKAGEVMGMSIKNHGIYNACEVTPLHRSSNVPDRK